MRCENCGETLNVSERQARRIRNGNGILRCSVCRGIRGVRASERDYRFWLSSFGMNVPVGTPALEAVQASGMPEDLVDLALHYRAATD